MFFSKVKQADENCSCYLRDDNSDHFPLKETAEKVPGSSCFTAPLKTQPVPATPAAVSRGASLSCSFRGAVLHQSREPSTETRSSQTMQIPPPKKARGSDSGQPRMIIDTLLIQIELSNKDSVAINGRLLLPSNKGNHARPDTVPSAEG